MNDTNFIEVKSKDGSAILDINPKAEPTDQVLTVAEASEMTIDARREYVKNIRLGQYSASFKRAAMLPILQANLNDAGKL